MAKYFVKAGTTPWVEVDKAEFVRAERSAGFYSKAGRPDEPATGGFSNGYIQGRLLYTDDIDPDSYAWDADFQAALIRSQNR